MREELLKGLSEEQIAKVKACKTQEEMLALAKQEGIELTDEQLEVVNGGGCFGTTPPCPFCHASKDHVVRTKEPGVWSANFVWGCNVCDRTWKMD